MNMVRSTSCDKSISDELRVSMFRLRHQSFKERLNWDVQSTNEQEIDAFDTEDTYYLIATEDGVHADGSWRLIPTTTNYMLERVFPQLLRGEKAPKNSSVWEMSRLSVRPETYRKGKGFLANTSLELISESYHFAVEHNIERYVTVTSVAVERMLRVLRLPIRRMGDGRSTLIGNVDSIALWVEVDERLALGIKPMGVHTLGPESPVPVTSISARSWRPLRLGSQNVSSSSA
jgi:N-acyl-L-homoserine lactone synthetase